MFSVEGNETPTCSSPVQTTVALSLMTDLNDSLRKLTIDNKAIIKPLSCKRNPFKARKKKACKKFSIQHNEYSSKGIEEITDKMVELWCSDGYREPSQKDSHMKKKTIHSNNKDDKDKSCEPTSSSAISSSLSTVPSSLSSKGGDSNPNEGLTCARQANCDYSESPSVNELAAYFEEGLFFPKKMSFMAEMMYT